MKTIKRVLTVYSKNDMGVYAGYATLFVVTAIFPLMMLVISIVAMIPGYTPESITDFVFRILPDMSQIQNLIKSIIRNLQNQSSGLLASVSALTTLWSASAGVAALQKGLKKMSPETKGRLPDRLSALIFTFLFIILIPAILIFQVLGEPIMSIFRSMMEKLEMIHLVSLARNIIHISSIVTLAAGFLIILFSYYLLPRTHRRIRDHLAGAVFTSVVWVLFTKLFAVFIPMFYHSSGIYGSLASLFLALMWLRLILTIYFLGGALNEVMYENRMNFLKESEDGDTDDAPATDPSPEPEKTVTAEKAAGRSSAGPVEKKKADPDEKWRTCIVPEKVTPLHPRVVRPVKVEIKDLNS